MTGMDGNGIAWLTLAIGFLVLTIFVIILNLV